MPNNQKQQSESDADFHGAAIIDKDGQEVAITEDMVKSACNKLDGNAVDNDNPDS